MPRNPTPIRPLVSGEASRIFEACLYRNPDFELKRTVFYIEANLRSSATRVAVDVGEALLEDAEGCEFKLARETAKVGGNIKLKVDAAAFGEAFYIPENRGLQAHLFEHRRI